MQLSRNKDSSKSSKKKDPKDGTASPGSTSQNSPTNTPSSSTSTLNDIRNKPLPPNSAGTNDGSAGATGQSPLSNMTSAPGPGASGSSPLPSNGAGSSQRGGLPPTVIISPSTSVGSTPGPDSDECSTSCCDADKAPLQSTSHHPVPPKRCLTTSLPQRQAQSLSCSTAWPPHPKTSLRE